MSSGSWRDRGARTAMLVTLGTCARLPEEAGVPGGPRSFFGADSVHSLRCIQHWLVTALLFAAPLTLISQQSGPPTPDPHDPAPVTRAQDLPPRVAQANRFLARRSFDRARGAAPRPALRAHSISVRPQSTATTAAWQPLGPAAVLTPQYGLVTGRISALALDPDDNTGNHLFVGTTGGGVWVAQNAATSNTANISFTPLTDNLDAMSKVVDASISIGALSIQKGGTGVILAGTGDPNDALDSYYGAGILRSTDGGLTWSLIPASESDIYSFQGEGFAGFAGSTRDPQLVVAAVSQAYEG